MLNNATKASLQILCKIPLGNSMCHPRSPGTPFHDTPSRWCPCSSEYDAIFSESLLKMESALKSQQENYRMGKAVRCILILALQAFRSPLRGMFSKEGLMVSLRRRKRWSRILAVLGLASWYCFTETVQVFLSGWWAHRGSAAV